MRFLGRLAVMLAIVSAAVSSALAQQRAEPIAGPDVRVGDTWIYNKLNGWTGALEDVSVNSVTELGAGEILIRSTTLDEKTVSRVVRNAAFNLVRVDGPDFVREAKPFYPNYSFPLHVGKTWKGTAVLTNTQGASLAIRVQLEGRATGWEMVTVPAGTYRALKLEMQGTYMAEAIGYTVTGTIRDTLWYVPEVRNAARYEYRDTVGMDEQYNHEVHELVRYWLAPR